MVQNRLHAVLGMYWHGAQHVLGALARIGVSCFTTVGRSPIEVEQERPWEDDMRQRVWLQDVVAKSPVAAETTSRRSLHGYEAKEAV